MDDLKPGVQEYLNSVIEFWETVREQLVNLSLANDYHTKVYYENQEENVLERAPWNPKMDASFYLYWKSFQLDKENGLNIPSPEMIAWDFAMKNNFTNKSLKHPLTPKQVYDRMVELGLNTDRPSAADPLETLVKVLQNNQAVPPSLAQQLHMRTSGLFAEVFTEPYDPITDPFTDPYGDPYGYPSSDLFDCPIPQDYVNILLMINLE